MNFTPLKIRAYIQTPIISDKYLPLEGCLHATLTRDKFCNDITATFARRSVVKKGANIQLPILKRNIHEPEWYYACSFAVWSPNARRGKFEFAKRFDTHAAVDYADFKGKRARIDTSRGQYKNEYIKEYTFETDYVEWYCRGDKEELEKLLMFVTHLGKHGDKGCGSVLRWEVSETDRDWYKNDNNGKRMRAIPSANGNMVYGIRPPYYLPHHIVTVYMPD